LRHRPDVVVVDESTMIDTHTFGLLATTVERFAERPKLVFLGDPNQLPPIGCGQPFTLLTQCRNVPRVALKVVHRQAGGADDKAALRAACEAIPELRLPTLVDGSFRVVEEPEPAKMERFVRLWLTSVKAHGRSSVVLCATNAARKRWQRIVREVFNPPVPGADGGGPVDIDISTSATTAGDPDFRLRRGDRVMQSKNDAGRDVFNGSVGIVEAITVDADGQRSVTVHFDGRDSSAPLTYTARTAREQLELAWAMTVHKAQGSEYDHALFVYGSDARRMLCSNLAYTAISRAKKSCCVLVPDASYLDGWKTPTQPRTSHLQHMVEAHRDADDDDVADDVA
jgi:exodeoxyribonuclease V alpha subunit